MSLEEKCEFRAGEIPPKGSCSCMTCYEEPTIITITKTDTVLPLCPICKGKRWYKYELFSDF